MAGASPKAIALSQIHRDLRGRTRVRFNAHAIYVRSTARSDVIYVAAALVQVHELCCDMLHDSMMRTIGAITLFNKTPKCDCTAHATTAGMIGRLPIT